MSEVTSQVWLVRHGETEWAAAGRHTGWRDIGLTANGEAQARALAAVLGAMTFDRVWSSPLTRARSTCRLAGFEQRAVLIDDLREWNYGDYEGRTAEEIRVERPGWIIWKDGVLGGETVEEVGLRAARVLGRLCEPERLLIFAHGHLLRVLTAVWLGLPPVEARRFAFRPAAISVLGYENSYRVVKRWNWEAQLAPVTSTPTAGVIINKV